MGTLRNKVVSYGLEVSRSMTLYHVRCWGGLNNIVEQLTLALSTPSHPQFIFCIISPQFNLPTFFFPVRVNCLTKIVFGANPSTCFPSRSYFHFNRCLERFFRGTKEMFSTLSSLKASSLIEYKKHTNKHDTVDKSKEILALRCGQTKLCMKGGT